MATCRCLFMSSVSPEMHRLHDHVCGWNECASLRQVYNKSNIKHRRTRQGSWCCNFIKHLCDWYADKTSRTMTGQHVLAELIRRSRGKCARQSCGLTHLMCCSFHVTKDPTRPHSCLAADAGHRLRLMNPGPKSNRRVWATHSGAGSCRPADSWCIIDRAPAGHLCV